MGRGLSFGCASASSSEVSSLLAGRSWVVGLGGDLSCVSNDEYCREETSDKQMEGWFWLGADRLYELFQLG